MRPVLFFCLASCVLLASCSATALGGYSETALKRAVSAGDLSFADSITSDLASRAAEKRPELPLFLALGMLNLDGENSQTAQAAAVLLTAAAGLARDNSGNLSVDSSLQRKIPFLNRAAALFRLCALTRQAAAAHSAAYEERESLLRDALFLQKLLNGENKGFLLPSASGESFPLSALRRFASAESSVAAAIALTQPFSAASSSFEDEAATLRRFVLERRYNDAAAIFFRIAARLGYVAPETEAEPAGEAAATIDESVLFTRDFLSAAGRALFYSSTEPASSAALLEYMLALPAFSSSGGEARYVLEFYLARIYAKMPSRSSDALAMMESSFLDAPTADDRDYSLWYMLDIARSSGNDELLALIEARLSEWRSPEVFSDILTRLITDLTADHSLASLLRLEAALPKNAPSVIRERVAFSIALLSPAGSAEERQRLEFLAENAESLYYRIRSAELLGRKDSFLRQQGNAPRATGGGGFTAASHNVPLELAEQAASLIKACRAWNLPGQASAFAEDFPFMDFSDAQDEAQRLIKAGYRTEGMRLLSVAFSRLGPEAERIKNASRETLEMLYPQAWRSEVESAAASTQGEGDAALGSLPESLIFAVIRQESFFNPDALSHAGAKGLMQLIDSTAAEVAARLKVSEYNLFSPETSIRFGSFYLSEMKRRLSGQAMQAVCAYNAGLGRVRSWLRDFPPKLPSKSAAAEECLFIESVPFNETRDYAKRVFASAAIYSALYY